MRVDLAEGLLGDRGAPRPAAFDRVPVLDRQGLAPHVASAPPSSAPRTPAPSHVPAATLFAERLREGRWTRHLSCDHVRATFDGLQPARRDGADARPTSTASRCSTDEARPPRRERSAELRVASANCCWPGRSAGATSERPLGGLQPSAATAQTPDRLRPRRSARPMRLEPHVASAPPSSAPRDSARPALVQVAALFADSRRDSCWGCDTFRATLDGLPSECRDRSEARESGAHLGVAEDLLGDTEAPRPVDFDRVPVLDR